MRLLIALSYLGVLCVLGKIYAACTRYWLAGQFFRGTADEDSIYINLFKLFLFFVYLQQLFVCDYSGIKSDFDSFCVAIS